MSDTGRVHQFFSYLLYTIAKENGEGIGESSFAAVVEKIMQQKCIRGIVVNNRITSVLRKKIGAICAKLKRAKKKSGGSVSRSSLTNGATKLILSSYFTSSWMINVMKMSAKRIFEEWHYQATETWGRARRHREKLQVWKKKNSKDSNVVNFHSPCDFVNGCHNDKVKVYGRWFFFMFSLWIKAPLKRLVGVSFLGPSFPLQPPCLQM